MYNFGERLNEIRLSRNKTVEELCHFVGIEPTTFYDYKNRGTKPRFDKLILIAECLNVSLDYLCGLSVSEWGDNVTQKHIDIANVIISSGYKIDDLEELFKVIKKMNQNQSPL